ncbi:MAG: bifunctional transaldolase/phosoglucose isomerase [Dehalococcoidia bacterium]|nr:MAG: bifunctional transaldolase/phosoglucose isomerase [Dehalococcoidia bacterium]
MATNPLLELQRQGQSVWQDYIRRKQTLSGELKRLIGEDGLRGQTSNPTYFEKAISGSHDYDDALRALAQEGRSMGEIYEALAVEDIQAAADLFRPVYDSLDGADGFVSLEVSPDLAHDTQATVEEARRLFAAVNRPNVMIKVPGTPEGMPAIEQLISEGINVNVTLLFSLDAHEQAANAYIAGLERRAAAGGDLSRVASVASFFLSRVDTLVDRRLEALIRETEDAAARARMEALLGKAAVANAKVAYARFKSIFGSPRFQALKEKGARVQRPLWASTGTKNPNYSDVMYVEPLIGPDTVNTMPPTTLDAFRDHGVVRPTVEEGLEEAEAALAALAEFGIDMDEVTAKLLDDGVRIFANSFHQLMDCISAQRTAILSGVRERQAASLGEHQRRVDDRLERLEREGFAARLHAHDASLWSADAKTREAIRTRLGWLTVVEKMTDVCDDLTSFADEIRGAGYRDVVLLGMGGSSLTPEVLHSALDVRDGYPDLIVLDTTDPASIRAVENVLDPAKALFLVASKSGTTVEALSLFAYFMERVKAVKGPAAGENFVAITDEGTPLQELARRHRFRRVFTNPSDIGGRYSALSYFGLVPAALIGADVAKLLDRGLTIAEASASCVAAPESPGLWLGAALGELTLVGRDKLTLAVSPEVASFGTWVEQLIAESTGKEGKGILPVDGETLGDPSAYGDDRLFVHLRLDSDDSLDAGVGKLAAAGHPVVTLRLGDAYDLGGEFFRWELATATAGAILGINPFDEPNVAESKENTRRLLEAYRSQRALPEGRPALQEDGVALFAEETGGGLAGALASFLRQVRPGDYIALAAYLARTSATEARLQSMRLVMRDGTRAATTLGFGPRYLHSTGQLHKGGGDNGVFILLTADDLEDLEVPGQPYTFGVLKRAQALGDLDALRRRGRRVVRLHLSGDVEAGLEKVARALQSAVASVAAGS